MATYVISDIHGAYFRLMDVLNQAHFDYDKDTLYVLGDIIDRLPHSGKILEWAYNCPSTVKFLRGNHEDMMLAFFEKQQDFIDNYAIKMYEETGLGLTFKEFLNDELDARIHGSVWGRYNGGFNTWKYLMSHNAMHVTNILDKISQWPLYYDIEVNGKRFILVHAGLAMQGIRMSDDHFADGLDVLVHIPGIDKTQWSQSLLWIRENWIIDSTDLPCDVVFGHTPSFQVARMLEDVNDWIKIDKGTPIPIQKGKEIIHFGKDLKKHCIDSGRNVLSLLRLDDMEEFISDISEELPYCSILL